MKSLTFKRIVCSTLLGAFWALGIMPVQAQSIGVGGFAEPGVLVSPARTSNSSMQNLETSLVDIKAIDAQTMHSQDGKTAMASDERVGQGIIIDPAGIIATSKHIIGNAQHIYAMLAGGRTFEAKVIHASEADLCFLKIDVPFTLSAITLADASQAQAGTPVFGLANAYLNAERRLNGQIIKLFKEEPSNNIGLIEMEMTLHPGDSGGPILNEQGSLVGLIMGNQKSDTTKSYAIASNKIQEEYLKYKNSVVN